MVKLKKAQGAEFHLVESVVAPKDARFGFLYANSVPKEAHADLVPLESTWGLGYYAFFDAFDQPAHPILARWKDVLDLFTSDAEPPMFGWLRQPSEFDSWLFVSDRHVREDESFAFRDYSLVLRKESPIAIDEMGFAFGRGSQDNLLHKTSLAR
jgi:hypothetical protein